MKDEKRMRNDCQLYPRVTASPKKYKGNIKENNMLKCRIRNLAVAATMISAATGLSVCAATSASATTASWPSSTAVALPSCPAHTLCTFQNANYGGQRWNYDYNAEPHATWFFVGPEANDQISSFYNARAWTSYFAKNCPADSQWTWTPGQGAVPNLNDGQHNWPDGTNGNDSISAIALGNDTGVSYPAHGSC